MEIFLETERLALRPLTEADLAHVLELDGDPEVMRFLDGGGPASLETVRDEVLPRLLRTYDFPGRPASRGFWAAETRSGGEFLGEEREIPHRPEDQPRP